MKTYKTHYNQHANNVIITVNYVLGIQVKCHRKSAGIFRIFSFVGGCEKNFEMLIHPSFAGDCDL